MKSFNSLDMRALSIMQPWAECIIFHGKNVENRSWSTQKRGYIAIHASARMDKGRYERVREEYGLKLDPEESSFGSILGFAKIVDVVDKKSLTRKTKKWFMGDYGFVLEDIIILKEPVPSKGSLSFWKIPPAVMKKCLAQMSKSEIRKLMAQ
ncbi:MAG: hypothetical protein K2P81_00550 [Bacteriovoracaceae bacterium]|nr:hypothetical protein [Bacteriovoracaceae bacterium]